MSACILALCLVIDLLWLVLYSLLYNKSTSNRTSGVRLYWRQTAKRPINKTAFATETSGWLPVYSLTASKLNLDVARNIDSNRVKGHSLVSSAVINITVSCYVDKSLVYLVLSYLNLVWK